MFQPIKVRNNPEKKELEAGFSIVPFSKLPGSIQQEALNLVPKQNLLGETGGKWTILGVSVNELSKLTSLCLIMMNGDKPCGLIHGQMEEARHRAKTKRRLSINLLFAKPSPSFYRFHRKTIADVLSNHLIEFGHANGAKEIVAVKPSRDSNKLIRRHIKRGTLHLKGYSAAASRHNSPAFAFRSPK